MDSGARTLKTHEQSGDQESGKTWGRANNSSWLTSLSSLAIMALCPALVMFTWIALEHFDASLYATIVALALRRPATSVLPSVALQPLVAYVAWLIFQAFLFTYLPGKLSTGQLTPAGHTLKYYTNGLLAWAVTHGMLAVAVVLDIVDPAYVAKNWASLLIAANVYGFLLSALAYLKAFVAPSHRSDRKLSGSRWYDFYMGVELNPRLGKYWDVKLFQNGRPGIIAWTIIDLSFTALQWQKFGYVTYSIIIANILHIIYVVDFFFNEDWYLRTIDIAHDHFGFYLAWGDAVWLPAMYTLQQQYLARHPVHLNPMLATCILATGISGYLIFRSANHQKDIVRRTNGDCLIWGKQAQVLRCTYTTEEDEKEHESLLLTSGWWGFSRHANYLGDLILAYSMCATCGFERLLPWTYAIFMTVLLVHRVRRSDSSCVAKYGGTWDQYRAQVRWALMPGVF